MTNGPIALVTVVTAAAVIETLLGPKPAPRFVWNVSESVPIGLYQVQPARDLIVTTLVVAYPPEPLATLLAESGYLPRDVLLIKRVLALPGQTVCRTGPTIAVDGIEIGVARERDHRGRLLPVWHGCRLLARDEVFLMNWDEPASLDGRYFGPIQLHAIVGRAIPLWTFERTDHAVAMPAEKRWAVRARTRAMTQLPDPGVLNRRHGLAAEVHFWLAAGPARLPRRAGQPQALRPPRRHLGRSAQTVDGAEIMDLTTLVTACALTVDPQVMHAFIWHQSGGEPWSFTVAGVHRPQVFRDVSEAIDAAHDTYPADAAIRVGLTGLSATPRSVTAAMFAPCSNITVAARQIADLAQLCKTSSHSNRDPIYCAIAAYRGSWDRADNAFADAVRTSVANNDAPDFEMPAGTDVNAPEVRSARRPAFHDTATASPAAPDDRDRARLSPLFPVKSRPSERSRIDDATSDRPAVEEQKSDIQSARPTPAQPPADGLFVPRSAQRSSP